MRHTVSRTINSQHAEVWKLVSTPAMWPTWAPDTTEVEAPETIAVGTTVSYKFRGGPVTATINAYDPGKKIGLQSTLKNYEFDESISLRAVGNSTIVTFDMGFKPTVWYFTVLAVLLWPVKTLLMGRPMKKELQLLEKAVMSPAPAAS